jgi:hypothetical protein
MDVATLTDAYAARVRALFGGEVPAALALEGRLAPGQWTLELGLPEWLGGAFGLDQPTRDALSVANALGLVAVRLRDDAADGELAGTDPQRAADLSARLLDAALEPYRARLAADSPFWPAVERWLADPTPGAPLKIPTFGICLMAERVDAWPVMEECLDHALSGLVLYDHAADWPADLAAGRENHFAAHLSAATAHDVRVALMITDRAIGYFDRMAADLTRGAELAASLEVGALSDHLRSLAARLRADGLALVAHYASVGERAAALFR